MKVVKTTRRQDALSTIATCFAALGPYGAWGKGLEVPIGKTFVIAFVLFAIVGHLDMVGRKKEAAKKASGESDETPAEEEPVAE